MIRLLFQRITLAGYCVEKGLEGIQQGTWRSVGVWIEDVSGFEDRKVEISTGEGKRERVWLRSPHGGEEGF